MEHVALRDVLQYDARSSSTMMDPQEPVAVDETDESGVVTDHLVDRALVLAQLIERLVDRA